jgi:hypothetical protein
VKQTPAQGLEDFDSLDEYVANWIRPCLLGDLRRLIASLTQDLGPTDERGRPYGAGKFVTLGALLFACEHLGALLVTEPGLLTNMDARFEALFTALKGKYADYKNILTIFGRHAIIHSFWPNTLLRFRTQRQDRNDPELVVVGLGVGIDPAEKDYRHFEVRLFDKLFPLADRPPGADLRHFQQPRLTKVTAIRLFVNVHRFFRRVDNFFHIDFNADHFPGNFALLRENFQLLRAVSIREKNFPSLPKKKEKAILEAIADQPGRVWNLPFRDSLEQELWRLMNEADKISHK